MNETQRNKQVIHELMAAADAGDLDAVMELYSPDYFDHDASESRAQPGSHFEALRAAFGRFLDWFPDTRHTIEDMIAEGDRVAVRLSARASHLRQAFGVPPSGGQVRTESLAIYRFEHGRIVERWCREEKTVRQAVEELRNDK